MTTLTTTIQRSDPFAGASKAALRRTFRRLRRQLHRTVQDQHAQRVARTIAHSGLLLRTGPIAAYIATAGELDPQPLLARARQQQRVVALPAIGWSAQGGSSGSAQGGFIGSAQSGFKGPAQGGFKGPAQGAWGELCFYRAAPGANLVVGRFGIPEPAPDAQPVPADAIGLLCLPLVAYDHTGTRLGQGGGYYDRLLARWNRHPANAGPLRIGLAHRCQRSDQALPREPWDQPLDLVVTEVGLEAFTARGRRLLPSHAKSR